MERNAEASADRNRSSFLGNLNDMVANSVENQLARGVEAEFAQSSMNDEALARDRAQYPNIRRPHLDHAPDRRRQSRLKR